MQKKTFALFFVILVSISWSKQEVEIPINIGVGPAFFWIPGVVGRELHPGAKFNLYAVITPKILQENQDKIPKKYREYVDMEEEMHIISIWMMLIPDYLIISPGMEDYIYGGLWSFFTGSISFLKNDFIDLSGSVVLPTITYLYTHAPKNDPEAQHLLGAGAMLRLESTIRFSENFLATLAYGHNFNIPLPEDFEIPVPTNNYKEKAKTAEQRWIQTGILSLVFHFRFNIKQKI